MGELSLAPVLLPACPRSGTGPGRAQRPRAVGASPCQHNTLLMLPWAACMDCCGCLEGRLWRSCSFPPLPSSCWLCKEGAWEPESQSTQSPFSSQGLGYTHLQVLAMGNCWRWIQTNHWKKKKKIQLEVALPGTRPGVGKLQIKLSEMLCVLGAQTKLFYALLEFLFIVSSETHPGSLQYPRLWQLYF